MQHHPGRQRTTTPWPNSDGGLAELRRRDLDRDSDNPPKCDGRHIRTTINVKPSFPRRADVPHPPRRVLPNTPNAMDF
jgi:hypothetical protein